MLGIKSVAPSHPSQYGYPCLYLVAGSLYQTLSNSKFTTYDLDNRGFIQTHIINTPTMWSLRVHKRKALELERSYLGIGLRDNTSHHPAMRWLRHCNTPKNFRRRADRPPAPPAFPPVCNPKSRFGYLPVLSLFVLRC